MTGGGSGFFTVGAPNGETGHSLQRGGNRADVRFDGTTLKLVANLGAGPPAAASGIEIATSGAVSMTGGGPGIVTFGSPNAETGQSIQRGGNRADVRFDGTSLKMVAGPGVGPPGSLNGLAVTTGGNVGIGTTAPVARLHAETGLVNTAAIYGKAAGAGGAGVHGSSTGTGPGVYGTCSGSGYAGYFDGSAVVTETLNAQNVRGYSQNGLSGVYGRNDSPTGWAGFFAGNVQITGTLSKAGGSFKIDHPLDPANKTLSHSFVESPDMMNIYNGNIALNARGEAVVELPKWFDALNKEFRYQLTCIGGFAPVYIAEEITGNRFKIAGGKAGLKVSWQVTGVRKDAWANANRIPLEEDKAIGDRGTYLHPQAFGQPATKLASENRPTVSPPSSVRNK